MAYVPVAAIMWRWCNQATYDTLHGNSGGQYHIAIPDSAAIHEFFEGVPQSPTDLNGFEMNVPLAPFEGEPPVPAQALPVRFMGPDSSRKDWNIRSQRPETAYPLWRPGRGVPETYDGSWHEYLVLARDRDHAFHARWISTAAFGRLPEWVRQTLSSKKYGARSYS